MVVPCGTPRVCRVPCLLLMLAQTGCSGLGARMQSAAEIAVRDPGTWGPLAGAAAIAATGSDRRISQWAKTRTPLFGSQAAAEEASDRYRVSSANAAWAIFLAAPKRGNGNWFKEKAIDSAAIFGGVIATRNLTGDLKAAVDRQRPHQGPVHDSFPSAHASDAFAHAAFGRYFAGRLAAPEPVRFGLQAGVTALAATTAWARVEAGDHYPTDVLAGAALGNFTTRFFMELSDRGPGGWRVVPEVSPRAVGLHFERDIGTGLR